MSSTYPYKDISIWLSEPGNRQAPLTRDIQADVVVIGGGYTGLSTALNLRERGVDVALLEQDFAGSGASGRNAGHVAPTIGKDIPSLTRFFGQDRAKKLVGFAEAAVDHIESVFDKYQIDCEYERNGNIIAGVHPKHEMTLRTACEAAKALGSRVTFLDDNEMRQRAMPRAFRFGVHEDCGGIFNPGLYVSALRQEAIRAGVKLFEGTALNSLEDGKQVLARTPAGSVKADAAVLATNAYTKTTGRMPRTVAPIRVTLFETAPLSDAQIQELGWIRREGVYTTHETLESYRLTARNTIVGGSKSVRYKYASGLAEGYHPPTFEILVAAFRERFPMLSDIDIAAYWGGWIGLTLDFLPRIGVQGSHGNVYYGLGYAGHGVPQATMMGAMLADKIEGREHEWEHALTRREINWPPEPLRWMGAKALTTALNAIDRRTDNQIKRK